jgi:hypothetical protein
MKIVKDMKNNLKNTTENGEVIELSIKTQKYCLELFKDIANESNMSTKRQPSTFTDKLLIGLRINIQSFIRLCNVIGVNLSENTKLNQSTLLSYYKLNSDRFGLSIEGLDKIIK